MNQADTGKFIATLRKEKNLTQEELARRLNVSSKSVSRWERAVSMPDLSMLQHISEEFGVSVDEILNGKRNGIETSDLKHTINTIIDYSIAEKRRFQKEIIKKVLVVILSAFTITVSCGYLYHANKEKNTFKLDDIENYTGTYKETNIGYILNIYLRLFSPGKLFDYDSYVKTSDGEFEVTMNQSDVIDLFSQIKSYLPANPVTSPNSEKLTFEINERVLNYVADTKTRLFKYELFNKEHRYDETERNQIREEILELPSSAIIDCGMLFKTPAELKDFLDLQYSLPDSIFTYIYTHDMEKFMRTEKAVVGIRYFGFALIDSFSPTVFNPVYENVDLFSLYKPDDEKRFDEDAVISHYYNCIDILLKCGLAYEDTEVDNGLEDRLKLIQEDIMSNGISVIAFRACLTKDDALKLLEDDNICHIVIADIKISKYAN